MVRIWLWNTPYKYSYNHYVVSAAAATEIRGHLTSTTLATFDNSSETRLLFVVVVLIS